MYIKVINGPNLNMLGMREPEIYGAKKLSDIEAQLKNQFPEHRFLFFQSNIEGELINSIQQSLDEKVVGIIINPGGYSHTSVAIADAIRAIGIPCIEVHISHIYSREQYRQELITAGACKGLIAGLGTSGYALAAEYLIDQEENRV